MRFGTFTLAAVILIVFSSRSPAVDPLPGTKPMIEEGDLASKMIGGIDRFLLRKIDEAPAKRAAFWKWDTTSIAAHVAATEPNRHRLAHILGLPAPRIEAAKMEVLSTLTEGPTLIEDDTVRIVAVRWEAVQDVYGEGLLLIPKGANAHSADVVAIPDSTQTPEALCGLSFGIPAEFLFPLRLARSGCRVLVPSLINREPGVKRLSNREWLYRPAFELGLHPIGYEIQKVLAGIDWFRHDRGAASRMPLGLVGYGDGGLIALYASALDARIDSTLVSGYFGDRSKIWTEPLDRNVFGLLERFGDAEVAAIIAPRTLVVEVSQVPAVEVPPGTIAGPGKIAAQDLATAKAEIEKARGFVKGLEPAPTFPILASGDGTGPPGSPEALGAFLQGLSKTATLKPVVSFPLPARPLVDGAARGRRQQREIERKTQEALEDSPSLRAQYFAELDTKSLARYRETIEPYRKKFDEEIIGRFDDPLLPLNARSRKVFDEPKYTGYEVMLDVFPDVFAYGILLLPKGLKAGEKRPVVVCQHGLEGRPNDVADPKIHNPAYNQFAIRLAERGFITFAPQNPYIFHDRFRTLQRKANPLGKTLFSIIVPQHRQIVSWLKSQDFVDADRIAFYGLSYGGKSAMRIPALVTDYCLSICSADFNEWVWKNASIKSPYSYVGTGEYEIFEFNLGGTFNYAEMASLICPRPFMVERGHFDTVAPDEKVAHEYAKVRRLYNGLLKIGDRTEIEFFDGPHTIHGVGTFDFLHKHLKWPKP